MVTVKFFSEEFFPFSIFGHFFCPFSENQNTFGKKNSHSKCQNARNFNN